MNWQTRTSLLVSRVLVLLLALASGCTRTTLVPEEKPIGVLTVTLGNASPAGTAINRSATGVVMLQLALAASATEAIGIDSITFSTSGSGE